MVVTQINTAISQIQYLFLLLKQNLKWPEQVEVVRSYLLIFFNLDWGTIERNIPPSLDWIFSLRFDFRVQYIVVCGVIPLVLSSFLLLQYTDAMGVCSFFLCCFGTFALVSALFGELMSNTAYLIFLLTGIGMLIAACVCFFTSSSGALVRTLLTTVLELIGSFRGNGRSRGSGLTTEINKMQNEGDNAPTLNVRRGDMVKMYRAKFLEILRFGASALILLVSGVMLTGVVRLSSITGEYNAVETAVFDSPFTWLFYVLAGVLMLQSIVHFIAFMILLVPFGEVFLAKVKIVTQNLTLKLSFTVLTLIFTPIVATLVTSFHCETFVCPAGTFPRERYLSDYKRNLPDNTTLLSPFYSRYMALPQLTKNSLEKFVWSPDGNPDLVEHWLYDATICMPCNYTQSGAPEQACGYSYNMAINPIKEFQTCPYRNVSLLQTDHTVSCGTMQNFYMWGSGVLMFIWCVGVPFLMLSLILIAIRYSEMIPSDVKDVEKVKKSVFDKVNEKVDEVQDKFWTLVLFKKYWPQKFVDLMHSDYNPIYFPLLKLMDGVAFVLMRVAMFEGVIWTRRPPSESGAKKAFTYHIAMTVTAFRNALKNSLRKDAAEVWFYRVGMMKNNLKDLYANYEFRTRFFYVWDLLIKLFLTVIASALINYPKISVSIMTGTHLVIVLTWFFVQPFLIFFEDIISFSLAVVTLINHCYALLNVFIEMPWYLYFLLIFNVIGPILSVIAIVLFFCLRNAKNNIKKSDDRYKSVKEEVESADKMITKVSVRMLNSFFFFVAVVTIIILGFCLVGLSRDQPNIVPAASKGLYTVNSCETRKKLEFAGYASWNEFTTNCCCHADPYFANKVYDPKEKSFRQVEIWHCQNGLRKLRLREAEVDNKLENGLYLRAFCSSQFANDVTLVTGDCKDEDKDEKVYYAKTSTESAPGYANKYLW